MGLYLVVLCKDPSNTFQYALVDLTNSGSQERPYFDRVVRVAGLEMQRMPAQAPLVSAFSDGHGKSRRLHGKPLGNPLGP